MSNNYFDPSTLTVVDGELAEAADINSIVAAVEAAFDLVGSDFEIARDETEFTATAGQTTFTTTYTVGAVHVYRNGFKLPSSYYTATSGTSIVLDSPCVAGDIIEVIG